MAINNLNPRRTVWFSPHEPSNKYDIWLSKNAHLDENGEHTTDSTAQRDCDYIFKIYDCGKWLPIVGFNSTAANKIDTVSGVTYTYNNVDYPSKTVCHPALFTAETPNELFDYGPMSKVLKELVTTEEWGEIYNTHLKTIIEQYPFDLWRAQPNRLGGICANTFDTIAANGFAECKFYNSTDNKLYVSGADILDAISESQGGSVDPSVLYRSFYNSPTILKGWQESQTSAQKPRFELSGSRVVENRGKIPMLRDDDWWETHGSGYTGDYDDTNSALVWVDLPEGIEYSAGTGITISQQNEISIDTAGASTNQVLTKTALGVGWTTPLQGVTYTAGIGINIQSNEISQNITKATPEATGTISQIRIDWASARNKFTVTDGVGYSEDVELYEVIDFADVLSLNSVVEYSITLIPFNTNPSYFILRNVKGITLAQDLEFINMPSDFSGIRGVLVTILFGIVKFEVIEIS